MAVSTIDGTIEEAVLKRARLNIRVYERICFSLRDGSSKTIAKAIVEEKVAELLLPGTSGRFYLYTTIDQRGIHGVRDDSGRAVFGFAKNNEKAGLWVTVICAFTVLLSWAVLGRPQGLALLIMILGVPMYFLYRSARLAAQRQFDADSGRAPAAATVGAG